MMFAVLGVSGPTSAQRILTFRFRPTARAQMVLWIERSDGTFMGTLRLTEAVARRGIGNRPGATQMNSGFHWPYGRREGVLPGVGASACRAPGRSSSSASSSRTAERGLRVAHVQRPEPRRLLLLVVQHGHHVA
jgi:hypothetical protein